jgi:uncharacterized UPF0160 family protein
VAVHNGVIHADEVFAVATLRLIEWDFTVVRTREKDILKTADIRIDVGEKYDATTGDFDHHQDMFAEYHEPPNKRFTEGPKLSGFGLIWRHYGRLAIQSYIKSYSPTELIDEEVDNIWNQVCRVLVAPIDALDNGEKEKFYLDKGVYVLPTVGRYIKLLYPSDVEITPEKEMEAFNAAVNFAVKYLKKEIDKAYAVVLAIPAIVDKIRETDPEPGIMIFDQFVPWGQVFNKHKAINGHIKLVIFPNTSSGSWMVQSPYYNSYSDTLGLSDTVLGERRVYRFPAPKKLWGKRDAELAEITGIEDVIFVHPSKGFIAAARSKEGAIALAHYYINNQDPE